MTAVDTATLAVALGVTPAHVRRLAKEGRIKPVGKLHNGRGRPAMLFSLEEAYEALRGDVCKDRDDVRK